MKGFRLGQNNSESKPLSNLEKHRYNYSNIPTNTGCESVIILSLRESDDDLPSTLSSESVFRTGVL